MASRKHSAKKLARDLFLIACSIVVAILIVQYGAFSSIVRSNAVSQYAGSFIAGLFFTSIFTIAAAAVALAQIAHTTQPVLVAFLGALGAMIGDYIMFAFVRDSLADDLKIFLKGKWYKKIVHIFKLRLFRRFVPLLGALIIASPLPDELGLAMMGFSKVSSRIMLPLTFIMNFLGILFVVWIVGHI